MIKAILFDFYGVLVTEKLIVFKDSYFKDPEKLNVANNLIDSLGMHKISSEVFRQKLSELAGMSVNELNKHLGENKPNEILLDYINTELKPKYKLGIVSNAADNSILRLLRTGDEDMFDSIVVSGVYGHIKPSQEIYEEAMRQLGVTASESIFVDDIKRYCDAAESYGIRSINYKSFDQMKSELEAVLI